MSTQLDPFQSALLAELRQVVDSAEATPARRPRPRRRVLAAAGLAAATTAGVVLAPGLVGRDPAFAVVPGANGAVDVRVDRLEDAAGLERALRQAGIRADVTYLPEGQACADGRYVDATASPDPGADFLFSFGGDGFRVRLGPGAIGDDQTLVIAVSPVTPGGAAGQVGVADGAVAACRPVAAPRVP